jgi:hypothetical protein
MASRALARAGIMLVVTGGAAMAAESGQMGAEPLIERARPPEIRLPGQDDRTSPLSFRVGAFNFTPGGFIDFTSIYRSTNTGNPGGTNFFAIPFDDTVAGHLGENRLTAQNSRLSLKADAAFGDFKTTGYVEADFLGNDAANVFVTSNSHTFRLRLAYADVAYASRWELLAGQAWSWLTPNRVGLSGDPSQLFYTVNADFNYQVGLTWARQATARIAYHPDENWALGFGVENPEQFGGQGETTFPAALNAQLGVQIDQANISSTPNWFPDVVAKVAYDRDAWGRHFHAETVGLLSGFKDTVSLDGGTTFTQHSTVGGGVAVAVNAELVSGLRVVANYFHSGGGGRYVFGMGPDIVVHPDGAISLVRSDSGIAGLEWQVLSGTLLAGYYGEAYFHRDAFLDTSAGAKPGSIVGFGGPGSGNNQNQRIYEWTGDLVQTFWKSPQYGTAQAILQYSRVQRTPFFDTPTQPRNAHTNMFWLSLRFIFP